MNTSGKPARKPTKKSERKVPPARANRQPDPTPYAVGESVFAGLAEGRWEPGTILKAPSAERGAVVQLHDGTFVRAPMEALRRTAPVDPTNPAHYRSHASGVECIQITEHLGFCLGNAVKYIWRSGERAERTIEDLRKAVWYLEREIARLEKPIPYKLAPKAVAK